MNITSSPEAVTEIERLMKLNENVLRYLTVRVESHDANPSALMQQRGFREDRFRGFEDEQQEEFVPEEGVA
jgi:small subunit ribosomal protein S6